MDFTHTNKRLVTIGNLPEHLTSSVLERLPIRDIVRTSILSKKWRYKWTTISAVVFDEQISKTLATRYGAFGRHGFIRVINHVLFLQKGPISKFYLCLPFLQLDSFQEVDHWILFLSTKHLEDLTLDNYSNLRYQLPFCVFSCLELRNLELNNCIWKPPSQYFEGFLYLESLILNNIDFTTEVDRGMINLPQLMRLVMHSCTNVYNLKIKATKLRILVVENCSDVMFLELLHGESLASVCITLNTSAKDFVRLKRMNLALMFDNMPKVQSFHIDGHLLRVFHTYYRNAKVISLANNNSLKCMIELQDISLGDMHHLPGVLCLLRSSPNLEELRIVNTQTEKLELIQVETASNHLESPDCLDQTLDQLQTVELSSLQGSRPQLLFIKLLLAHSPSLEKFVIQPSKTSDAYRRFNIVKDVMRFPRASSKAELIYLDP